jgi:hypothetical protein
VSTKSGLHKGASTGAANHAVLAQHHQEVSPLVDTRFVTHYIRVMKSRLRNVTVSLEENVARWARLEAARRETSVSRLLGEILKERMLAKDSYERAMRKSLAREPFLKTDGRYLSREEVHDRARLR